MIKPVRWRRALSSVVAVGAAAAFAAAPASATSTPTDPSAGCTTPALSQPFLASGDAYYYFLAPGQTATDFTGEGWTLSGGAKLVSVTRADGSTGYVLDLPSGSKAVSPSVCVTSAYPQARTTLRNVKGSQGVSFYVSYQGTTTWSVPKNTGQFRGNGTAWTLAGPVNLQPAATDGWQTVKFTFVPGGTGAEYQLYDFFVDPRMY